MKRFLPTAIGVLAIAVAAGADSHAALLSPLTLRAVVGPAPGQPGKFRYEFRLIMTNDTGTWLPVQGFGGIVFGDVQSAPSPLADFVLDPTSVPAGPWTGSAQSNGFHNGPTLTPLVNPTTLAPVLWTPAAVGDQLTWAGTSSTFTCDLTFSTLHTGNLGDPAEFEPVVCTPEPATLALIVAAIALSRPLVRGRRTRVPAS